MTGNISLNAHSYSVSGGKLYVPVKPSNVIYSQFDHISGVAAKSNQTGVSVSKIKILNTMIDNLVKLRNQPKQEKVGNEISDERLDALIETYQNEIKTTINLAQQAGGYGLAGATPQAGQIFSIDA